MPDLFEIDIVSPANYSEDLVDLKPYLGSDIGSFPPELIQALTIGGRLVGIPLLVDTGLLYYRSDLLRKYGFAAPPKTWNELEEMSRVIQNGERRAGKKTFGQLFGKAKPPKALPATLSSGSAPKPAAIFWNPTGRCVFAVATPSER